MLNENQYTDEFITIILQHLNLAHPDRNFTPETLHAFCDQFQNKVPCDAETSIKTKDINELIAALIPLKRYDVMLFIASIDVTYYNNLTEADKSDIDDFIDKQNKNKLYVLAKVGSFDLVQVFIDRISQEERMDAIAEALHKLKLLNISINEEVQFVLEEAHTSLRSSVRYEADTNQDARKVEENNPNIDLQDEEGRTSLYVACLNGHFDIVKSLLDRNANIDLQNKDGITSLYVACCNGHFNIVKLLLDRKANIDLPNKYGFTSLHIASKMGHFDIVKLLLDRNADIDLQDTLESSSLHQACEYGHFDIVELLLDRNSNIELQNHNGFAPLFVACLHGHLDIVKLLLDRNASIDLQSKHGQTPLQIACYIGHINVVTLLLERNAAIYIQDSDGNTSLHTACAEEFFDITKLLLEKNAIYVDLENIDGYTALDIAMETDNLDIAELLDCF